MSSRVENIANLLRLHVAEAALSASAAVVADRFRVTEKFVRFAAIVTLPPFNFDFGRYWHLKLTDPTFHAGELGGAHHVKFSDVNQLFVEVRVTKILGYH